jgi:prepilin signal peptidase PulO-like enzyme (type II secretory pathway)
VNSQQINLVSSRVVLVLSLIALVTVLIGYTHPLPLPTDEETGAHIFQLSIVALVPLILLFLSTADWKQPWRSVRPLTLPATVLVLAFGALYYLEHYR